MSCIELPESTADLERGKQNLDEFGVTIHDDYIPKDQLAALLARVEEQAAMERQEGVATIGTCLEDSWTGRPADDTPPTWQIVNFLPNKGREFIALAMHPVARAYADHIFRSVPYNLVNQSALIVRKGSPQQVLHVDQQALPFLTPIPAMINVFLCLSDFEADMGATRLLPGSHRGPPPEIRRDKDGPAENAAEVTLAPAVARAGSAIIWESRTWHCQGPATSDKARWAVSSIYGMHFMKPQCNYPALIEDDVYDTLSLDEREMLGFKVAYNYAGRLTPRSPADARANTNCFYPYIPELRRNGAKHAKPDARMAPPRTATVPNLVK